MMRAVASQNEETELSMHLPVAPSVRRPLSRPLAYVCLASSMALVGSYVALSRPLVAALPIPLLAWLRFGLGVLVMWPWLHRTTTEPPMCVATQRLVFLESLLGNFLFSICMLYGVGMTGAVSAGLIMAGIPAATALMGWVFLRERIGMRIGAAVACAALSMGLMAVPGAPSPAATGREVAGSMQAHSTWLGPLLVLAAVLCEAAYAVIGKKLTHVLRPQRISAVINLWGFVLMAPWGLWTAIGFDFGAVPVGIWALLLFYALAASVGTVWLWMTGLTVVSAAQAGIFTVMLPVSATLVGVFVLGEPLRGFQLLACAFALTGVVLVTATGNRPS